MFSKKSMVNPFPFPGHGHMFSYFNSSPILNELKATGKSLAHLYLSLTLISLAFCSLISTRAASSLAVYVVSSMTFLSAASDFSSTVVIVLVKLSICLVADLFSSST
jgi:hypothetical protein